ncbi:uroporphyrinogen-III synthase [Pseudomonas sp. ABC1]|uniref:uroporphyrinogen-III synthase n=1 Tax=Pseudomonas sp. ABC1 TaxID=2748080 RepID=UPI0015C35665|nr:uroporphyrinogen-III synthase [Pseudomonas sp. ABC1]QLF93135.1 uroporphyrinogen-III synthase [Pseudomonas sp. ABC1]
MSGWRLLITRPEADGALLGEVLNAQGIHSSSLPLLAIEALPETPEQRALLLDLDRYCAVVVVSKPAARLGLERLDRYWPQPPHGQRWFSVGAATGEILREYGLDTCWPVGADDSEALLALPELDEALAQPTPKVLILRGEGGRTFFADTLRARGVEVDSVALYRRFVPDYHPTALVERVRSERLNALVVSSGEGLHALRVLAGDDWHWLRELVLFVPSPRVAELARQMEALNVVDCRGAGTTALLAALRDTPVPAS